VGIRYSRHILKPQHDDSTCNKCVAKLEKSPCFGVNVGIKKETVTDTFVSITVSVMKIDPASTTSASKLFAGCIYYAFTANIWASNRCNTYCNTVKGL